MTKKLEELDEYLMEHEIGSHGSFGKVCDLFMKLMISEVN